MAHHRHGRDLQESRRAVSWKTRIDRASGPSRGPAARAFRDEKDRADRAGLILQKTKTTPRPPDAAWSNRSRSGREVRESSSEKPRPGRMAPPECGFG